MGELAAVDVIVPVYNALEYAQACVRSVLRHATPGTRLILVNDFSDAACSRWLRDVAAANPAVSLIEHPDNRGYTRACNSGLRASTASSVVLLNSDTVVTEGWLAGLQRCAQSSERIGLVGPLSNAASWQSVPTVVNADGVFAINAIPEGLSVDDVAAAVRDSARRTYPRVPLLNGFCYLVKRRVLDAVGLLDEDNFPVGYGEENDFCIRATGAGFELAVADDVYVYHAKSKSFGDERRTRLSRLGRDALNRKHGSDRIEALAAQARAVPELEEVRVAVQQKLDSLERQHASADPLGIKVLFLLPVRGGGGGAHSVVQEAVAMRRLGVRANVAIRDVHADAYRQAYADIAGIEDLLLPFADHEVPDIAGEFDVVVATAYSSVELLERVSTAYPDILPAYYVQDYEPMFFDEGTPEWHAARASYARVPGALLFAKTDWLVRKVNDLHGLPVRRVVASLDHELYHPAGRSERPEIHLAAMIRPQTPRRAAPRTMRVLAEVARSARRPLAIHLFGCDDSHPAFASLQRDFPFTNHGALTRPEVAALLRSCDLFIDLSDYQAFGRTGLEAMASGCAVVLPRHGGTDEYAVDGHNAVLVDTSDDEQCIARISELIHDRSRLALLRRRGLKTAAAYSPHRAAVSELTVLADGLAAHRRAQVKTARRRLALLPHTDYTGDVSAAGHVRVLQPWRHPQVQRAWAAELTPQTTLPAPGSAEIAILQVDSPWMRSPRLMSWFAEWRQAGSKLLFELCDDVGCASPQGSPPREWSLSDAAVAELARLADALVVPTERLRDAVRHLNGHVFVVPSYLEARQWPLAALPANEPRADSSTVRIGLMGSPDDAHGLDALTEAIQRIERDFSGKVLVEVVGVFEKHSAAFGERVGWPRRRRYNDYINWLKQRVHWDIGLLPVRDDDVRSHADLTYFRYAALGIPTIATRSTLVEPLITQEHTGLLVEDNSNAWYDAIKRLMLDEPLRQALREAAHARVAGRFTLDHNAELYLRTLEAVQNLPPRQDLPAPGLPTTNGSDWTARFADTRAALSNTPLGRKARKLLRDPQAFLTDSKLPLVRELGSLLSRRAK